MLDELASAPRALARRTLDPAALAETVDARLHEAAAALAGSFLLTAAALGVIGATLIWRTVADVDDAKTATALNAFKANALIGLAVAGAFALAGVWRVMGSLAGAP